MQQPTIQDRRRHPRTLDSRPVQLCYGGFAYIFTDSIDISPGGMRVATPPHFRPRVNDRFAVLEGESRVSLKNVKVVALSEAGVHLEFAA